MEPFTVPEQRVAGNMGGREVAILKGFCIAPPLGCGREISSVEFASWDTLTVKEYKQSGWCTTCQDKFFRDPEERDCCCVRPCSEADVGVGVITCASAHCTCGGEADPTEFHDRIYEHDMEGYYG